MSSYAIKPSRTHFGQRTAVQHTNDWRLAQKTSRVARPAMVEAKTISALNALDRLSSLHADWDGPGTFAPSARTIANARFFLRVLIEKSEMAPELFANGNGTISMEWERERGSAHLEIGRDRFSMYIRPASGESSYFDGATADNGLNVASMASRLQSSMGDDAQPRSAQRLRF